jgi:hypothetical protein
LDLSKMEKKKPSVFLKDTLEKIKS